MTVHSMFVTSSFSISWPRLNPSDPDFEFEEFMILAAHDFVDVD